MTMGQVITDEREHQEADEPRLGAAREPRDSRAVAGRDAADDFARTAGPDSDDEISLAELFRPVAARWRQILMLALVSGLLAYAGSYLIRPKYAATTSFTPETGSGSRLPSSLAGLAGLASQFGVGPSMLGSTSPEYYAALVRSREILESVLRTPFADSALAPRDSARPLLDLLRVKGRTEQERLRRGVRELEKRVSTDVEKSTGIVRATVAMESPSLAAAVANHLVAQINRFNVERKQSQSRAQRRFTEQRVAQAQGELRDAERLLLSFLQANRSFRGSPLLEFEESRLQRAVQQKQQVYMALSQAYEESRIAEVQDTPLLTVIDAAVPPDRRSSPHRTVIAAAAMVAAGLLALAAAYAAHFIPALRRRAAGLRA